MAMKTKTIRKTATGTKVKPWNRTNLMIDPNARNFSGSSLKFIRGLPLSPRESNNLLLAGNQSFSNFIKSTSFNINLKEVQEKPVDLVLINCSDARTNLVLDLESHLERRVATVMSAGNIVPSGSYSQGASVALFQSILNELQDGAKIIVLGHVECGAVHAASKGPSGMPEDIAILINEVNGKSEVENVRTQIKDLNFMLEQTQNGKKLTVGGAYFNWDTLDNPVVGIDNVSQEELNFLTTPFMKRANLDLVGGSVYGLQMQYAHAIICYNPLDIPVTGREVLGIELANRAFVVTPNQDFSETSGFDAISKGSMLYSLMYNRNNNVILIHTDAAVLGAWKSELNSWFGSLITRDHEAEKIVGKRYKHSKKRQDGIEITCMQFNMDDGSVKIVNP